MAEHPSLMRQEIAEIPHVVERLLAEGDAEMRALAKLVREKDPRFLISVARGSSDHACAYLKYVAELTLGLPTASVGPSVHSIYSADLRAGDAFCVAISQSGQSPDSVGLTGSLKKSGALTLAITNDPGSPLAQVADATLALRAGPERSVAATKTFVASLVAGVSLMAEIADDAPLRAAIRALPGQLEAATRCDWSDAAASITGGSVLTLGRGPSLAVAHEAALKLKETCRIHGEGYSSAEVQHGPISLVGPGMPILAFAAGDAAEPRLAQAADALAQKGAQAFITSQLSSHAEVLPHVRTDHPLTDPIAAIVSFYVMVEALARSRGLDPDTPPHLSKVTETV
ncbi:MAG: SIS domain-containing protein [Devosiaceae bacterium]|nr:SIS domain-containing protein [Devosiaceae bacterium MH13]